MSQRARAAKTSATSVLSHPKSTKKPTRSNASTIKTNKKSSPTKHLLSSSRKKRLSSLTAATLLQYCTNILSPSSNDKQQKTAKRKLRSTNTSPMSRNNQNKKKTKQSRVNIRPSRHCTKSKMTTQQKRQISNTSSKADAKPSPTELTIPPRSRREASSRASAMIMQQNEIERSRFNYSLTNQRHRTKNIVTHKAKTPIDILPEQLFKFNIPPLPAPVPSTTNESNKTEHNQSSNAVTTKSVHSLPLTEATLAEHDRFHERTPPYHTTKRDNLIKWTQELALHGRLSPPLPEHELPPESSHNVLSTIADNNGINTTLRSSTKGLADMTESTISSSLEYHHRHSLTTNNITTPTCFSPSTAFPTDLRSFYPLLSCWQYPGWTFQTPASLLNQIQPSSSLDIAHQKVSIIQLDTKTKEQSIISSHKKNQEALTFHLHTHHHHHIHNPKKSSLLKSIDPQIAILPLSVNNVVKEEHISITTENEALDFSIKHLSTDKKTTRRKSSPVTRPVHSESNSSRIPFIVDKAAYPINSISTSPVSNTLSLNGDLPVGDDDKQKSSRRVYNRRSVSAATANTTTIVSITDRTLRGNRTNSASTIPMRSKSSTNRKRLNSPASVSLSSVTNQRKRQKVLHSWVLSGRSERKLVSIDAEKPPVYRKCYSSIRHIKEKDIIKSGDCVLLRPETASRNGITPYLAKVKWFWEEPISGEMQMSLIWYYHPEHAELPLRVKERFLPNEILASKYWDCVSVACIEDKCYVLNVNEYNRYCLRESSANLFEHSEPVGQLKSLLNRNTPTVHHRPLPAKYVDNQNIFFCRYVYDYRAKRILKNPTMTTNTTSTM